MHIFLIIIIILLSTYTTERSRKRKRNWNFLEQYILEYSLKSVKVQSIRHFFRIPLSYRITIPFANKKHYQRNGIATRRKSKHLYKYTLFTLTMPHQNRKATLVKCKSAPAWSNGHPSNNRPLYQEPCNTET